MHGTFKTIEAMADPFSLDTLIAWLEKQPADGAYDYSDPFNCLLCQYFRACGLPTDSVTMNHRYPDETLHKIEFPRELKDVSQGDRDIEGWFYGAALERARLIHSQR